MAFIWGQFRQKYLSHKSIRFKVTNLKINSNLAGPNELTSPMTIRLPQSGGLDLHYCFVCSCPGYSFQNSVISSWFDNKIHRLNLTLNVVDIAVSYVVIKYGLFIVSQMNLTKRCAQLIVPLSIAPRVPHTLNRHRHITYYPSVAPFTNMV